MAELMTPTELIGLATQELTALPACITGSAVAAETYGLPLGQFADLDVFCYSAEAVIVGAMRLMAAGFEIEERLGPQPRNRGGQHAEDPPPKTQLLGLRAGQFVEEFLKFVEVDGHDV